MGLWRRTRVQEPFDHGRGCEVLLFCVKGEFWFLDDPAANIYPQQQEASIDSYQRPLEPEVLHS